MDAVRAHLNVMDWEESPLALLNGPNGEMYLDVTAAFKSVQEPVDSEDDTSYQADDQIVATAFVMDGGYNKKMMVLVMGPSERVHNYICYFHPQDVH